MFLYKNIDNNTSDIFGITYLHRSDVRNEDCPLNDFDK